MSSGSLNAHSSEYAMILPAVVFKMSESIEEGEVQGSTSGSNVDNNGGIDPGNGEEGNGDENSDKNGDGEGEEGNGEDGEDGGEGQLPLPLFGGGP